MNDEVRITARTLNLNESPQLALPELDEAAVVDRLRALLIHIAHTDLAVSLWVGFSIYKELNGADIGLELYQEWSAKGPAITTKGAVASTWRSAKKRDMKDWGFQTLETMVKDRGVVLNFARSSAPENAQKSDTVEGVIEAQNRFQQSSLRDRHHELKQEVQEQRGFLEGLALLGQSTVFYADPNTGKTLCTLSALINSVRQGEIVPENVYYLNADDSGAGLAEKAAILKEYGVHMLGDGYQGFAAENFKPWTEEMIRDGSIKGKIFVLDTLTKFVDSNNKTQARNFTKHVRALTSKGATVVALAHTRKNVAADGSKVYAGTSDVFNDFDCTYMVVELSAGASDGLKTVEFQNKKRRGDVKLKVAYSYPNVPMKSYEELLLSVQLADPDLVSTLNKGAEIRSDMQVIEAIKSCVAGGVKTRMQIANTVGPNLQYSRAKTLAILDKYSGIVPGTHFWTFTVGERGAHIYVLVPQERARTPDFQLSSPPQPAPQVSLEEFEALEV
ncbi:AAA family ATPase [Hydrogenophaga sp. 2FB]|uniref:AAA family ATPase n=1 Tax=Hydrogenophaga sp. 2FB TaxID=2502187 RepID=UPI0010FA44FB|nr:AAA family ATPase [Hydrogenophaga sp. 2FB]